jgi:hypothetical protein
MPMADSICSAVAPIIAPKVGGGGDRAVDDVVDLVGLEAEDLGEAAADLVEEDHARRANMPSLPISLGGGDGRRSRSRCARTRRRGGAERSSE